MPLAAGSPNLPPGPAWFCLRTRPKHEHIAAQHLRRIENVEVFLPRIRFRHATRRGAIWTTEALFPNYLFARFDWAATLRRVHYAPGVTGVVHFGDRWPTIPDAVIAELQQLFGPAELRTLPAEPTVGDTVLITSGVFQGLRAVVTQVMPARARVSVLLDFLGRQTTAQLPIEHVVTEHNPRAMPPSPQR
ncbi:MAG: transcriptional activator RfaH [Verrucomicrobiae bacterium]|nr:transcriptional activator RfaH [Verrucomicrobiae bacterium]